MRNYRFVFIGIALISLTAFNTGRDCKEILRKAFSKLNNNQKNALDSGLLIEYSVITTLGNDKKESVKDRVKLLSNKEKSLITSNTIDIYRDQYHQVSIVKDKKQVIITKAEVANFNEVRVGNLLGIQDSLLKNSDVLICKESAKIKGALEVSLSPYKEVVNKTGIEKATFWINPKQFDIKRLSMFYKERPVKEVSLDIIETNFNYTIEIFSGKALDKVMNKNGKLLPGFSAYNLVDLRKKQK